MFWRRLLPAYCLLRSGAIARRWYVWPRIGLGWVLFESCYLVHGAVLVSVVAAPSRTFFAVAYALANGHQPWSAALYGETLPSTDAFVHLAPATLTWAARWFDDGACWAGGCRAAADWFWLRVVPCGLVTGYVVLYLAAHVFVSPRRAITTYRVHAEFSTGVLHGFTGVAGDRWRLQLFAAWELVKRNAGLPIAAACYRSFAFHTACLVGAHGACLAREAYSAARPFIAREAFSVVRSVTRSRPVSSDKDNRTATAPLPTNVL